jgi:hypothetical protein
MTRQASQPSPADTIIWRLKVLLMLLLRELLPILLLLLLEMRLLLKYSYCCRRWLTLLQAL